jgi:hypothetical protein
MPATADSRGEAMNEHKPTQKDVLKHVITDCWFSDAMTGVGPDELRAMLLSLAETLPEYYRDCFDEATPCQP